MIIYDERSAGGNGPEHIYIPDRQVVSMFNYGSSFHIETYAGANSWYTFNYIPEPAVRNWISLHQRCELVGDCHYDVRISHDKIWFSLFVHGVDPVIKEDYMMLKREDCVA